MLFLAITRRINGSRYRWIYHSYRRSRVLTSAPISYGNGTRGTRQRLPDGPARTRFAPSPTGYLHLGSLRTALFNYLLAKSTGGQFLLRIEDTDQKRTIADAEDRLYRDLMWAGLQWDEGPLVGGPYGPYKQSQRTVFYREHADLLIRSGHAYRCFCTPQRLHAFVKKRTELGLSTWYDRTCANILKEESERRVAKGEAHVVRFKVPSYYPKFTDLVYGKVGNRQDQSLKSKSYPAFEDPILLKSDGFPTYHLANVVDDHHMKITHVVRGAEWMTSTHMHLAMYEAFDWEPPAFAHVGLLTDQNHQKLSKRNMDLDMSAFRDKMGIFPEALTNFIALLGWSHDRRTDIMDLQELIRHFTMKFTKGDAVVTFEKLWYLQRAHAERYARSGAKCIGAKISLITEPLLEVLKERGWMDSMDLVLGHNNAESYVAELVRLDARNYTTASAFADRSKYFFQNPDEQTLLGSQSSVCPPSLPKVVQSTLQTEALNRILSPLELIPPEAWTTETIRDNINNIIIQKTEQCLKTLPHKAPDPEEFKVTTRTAWTRLIHRYIRWAIAAGMPGPDGVESMKLLGRDVTLARLANAAKISTIEQAVLGEGQLVEVAETH